MPGHRPPRVARFWHLLMDMQAHIEGGMTPNAAAETLAQRHWREISASQEAAVQWFKRSERRFRNRLRNATRDEKIKRMFERMQEEANEQYWQWLQQHGQRGLTPSIALLDLERLLKERDREKPGWRALWRERYGRDPEDMLTFFREVVRPEPEEGEEEDTASRQTFYDEAMDGS
jgi:hypothetical protein